MCSPKWEACERVFKRADFPELLAVTFVTARKSAAVNVVFGVARLTVLAQARQFHSIAMALGTVERVVNSSQSEVFMEVFCDLPIALGVALLAFLSEVAVVNVFVTGDAIT